MMRFERTWYLLTLTPVFYLGCASVDKQDKLWTKPVSEPLVVQKPELSKRVAQAVVPNLTLYSANDSSVMLASSVEPAPSSEIVVTTAEPPRSPPLATVAAATNDTAFSNNSTPDRTSSLAPSMAEQPGELPIDLETALQLAVGQNPQVAYANERIRESYAKLESARVLWLPSLRAGMNYNKHEGRIQDVAGTVIETSRNSVYNGFGAHAVGASSPAVPGVLMNFHMKDSIFQPRIAEQIVGANRHASQAVSNDTLLDTAIAYVDLLEAAQLRAISTDTLANTVQLASLTHQFATVGQGLQSDADRAATELAIRKLDVQRTIELSKVHSVRLARLLSQDPSLILAPVETVLAPIELVDVNTDMASLVAQGLSMRPELTEHRYLVGEAIERLRREQYSPLVPSVLLGLSYGGNGGGIGSSFQNYGDRMDFDAGAFWEVRNLGYGERAARCESQSRIRQARYRQVQILDRVASEIVEAKTQVDAKQAQIDLAQSAIATARDSYRRNNERIVAAQGLPIEVQQSIIALDQAQRLYATTVADYNRAQFRLQRSLGFPVSQANYASSKISTASNF